MPSIFSKNCILTGLINHYCLVCSKHFEDEEETLAHTLDPLHKQNLNSNGYFDKYQGDLIRKLKGLYFCELCTMTFPTATKVGLHVAEECHITKKSEIIQVCRKSNDIVAFGRFIISEDAWNGFIDDTCYVCHAEFDDKAAHKISKCHILKLIKSDVILGDSAIYRKIDDKLFQCITCNLTISETKRSKHFITTEHSKALNNNESYDNKTADTNGLEKEVQNIAKTNEHMMKLLEIEKNIKPGNKDKNKNQDEIVKTRDKQENTQVTMDKIQENADQNKDQKDENQDKADKTQDGIDKTQEKTDIIQNEKDRNQYKAEKMQEKTDNNKNEKDKIQDKTEKTQDRTKKNQDKGENNKGAVNKMREDNAKSTKTPVDKEKSVVDLDEVYCKSLGAKDYIAGMIGEKWCILCERVLDVSADEHIRSKHHQMLLKMHKERVENNNSQNSARNSDKTNLLEFVDRYQQSNVKIDLINETAFCKKCCENIEFDSDAIDKHIEDHKKKVNKKSKGKPQPSDLKSYGCDKTVSMADSMKRLNSQSETWSVAKLEEFAKQYGLTRNRSDNSFYCNACSRRLPTTREDLDKHVRSEGHKDNIFKQSFRKQIAGKTIQKVPVLRFLENFKIFETDEDTTDIVINGKYCLNAYGFCLLAKAGHKIICLGCGIDLAPEYVTSHIISTESHMRAVTKCLVVTSFENEFVREIKPKTYHCGFCNTVGNDWEDVLDHLTTEEHKRCKIRAHVALEKYAADRSRSSNSTHVELMFLDLMKKFKNQ